MAVELAFSIKVMIYTNLWFLDLDFFMNQNGKGFKVFKVRIKVES